MVAGGSEQSSHQIPFETSLDPISVPGTFVQSHAVSLLSYSRGSENAAASTDPRLTVVGEQVVGNAAAPRYRLQRIITTREENHKAGSPPNTLEDLEQYADGTVAQVQALQVSSQPRTASKTHESPTKTH